MLSISKIFRTGAALAYYVSFAVGEYYHEAGSSVGKWCGHGAELLGLRGNVDPQHLSNLFNGLAPDGTRELLQNVGQGPRKDGSRPIAAHDLTFSAPKSVSVLWGLSEPDKANQILSAHRAACQEVLEILEPLAGFTRSGKGGAQKLPAHLVFALFDHFSSRANEPQLHTHALLLKVCLTAHNGQPRAVFEQPIFQLKMAMGALYRASLASRLREVGYNIKYTEDGFEVADISPALMREFSTRRTQIKSALESKGLDGPVQAERQALKTRPAKKHLPIGELRDAWRVAGLAHGWTPNVLPAVNTPFIAPTTQAVRARADVAADHLIREKHAFTQAELIQQTANAALEIGAGASDAFQAARAVLRRRDIVMAGYNERRERLFTSRSATQDVTELAQRASDAVEHARPSLTSAGARRVIDCTPDGKVKDVVRKIVSEKSPVHVLDYLSPAERNRAVEAIQSIYELANFRVSHFGKTVAEAQAQDSAAAHLYKGKPALFGLEAGYRSLLKRRTDKPHLELQLPCFRLGKQSTPILQRLVHNLGWTNIERLLLLVTPKPELNWPQVKQIVLFRLLGAKLVLVVKDHPKPNTPSAWLLKAAQDMTQNARKREVERSPRQDAKIATRPAHHTPHRHPPHL